LITLAHLRTQQARHDPDQLYEAKWQLTKLLYQHGWRKERIIILFKVINWMMSLPEPHQQRFWQAILKLEKERKMEWISPLEQSFIDKGWKKGLEQGMELGRKQGALTVLERLLTRRFGPLPKTAQKKLAKADLGQLEAWSDALPEAQSLKQVFE
jgi:flagellar biosynthesis/type III secretory pathway protein FliH